jgi:hypothetical protein
MEPESLSPLSQEPAPSLYYEPGCTNLKFDGPVAIYS